MRDMGSNRQLQGSRRGWLRIPRALAGAPRDMGAGDIRAKCLRVADRWTEALGRLVDMCPTLSTTAAGIQRRRRCRPVCARRRRAQTRRLGQAASEREAVESAVPGRRARPREKRENKSSGRLARDQGGISPRRRWQGLCLRMFGV